MTASISPTVIHMFRLYASSSLNFGILYFSRNFSISPRFSNFLAYKGPGPGSSTGEFYKALKEELTPVLHRIFEKNPN